MQCRMSKRSTAGGPIRSVGSGCAGVVRRLLVSFCSISLSVSPYLYIYLSLSLSLSLVARKFAKLWHRAACCIARPIYKVKIIIGAGAQLERERHEQGAGKAGKGGVVWR